MIIAKKVLLATALCVGCVGFSAFSADLTDDVIKLSGSGVSDDVMLAWAEQQHGAALSAENILALKDHKVSDKVILTLLRGSENVPLNVAQLPSKVVQDRGWLRKVDETVAPQAPV